MLKSGTLRADLTCKEAERARRVAALWTDMMGRWRQRGGRWLAAVGIAANGGYLGWRAITLPHGSPLWLSAAALVVEAAGLVGACLLCWALWPGLHDAFARSTRCVGPVDVVVRVTDQPLHALRATLLTVDTQAQAAGTVVVDLAARIDVAKLAHEFGAHYVTADREDHNGLKPAALAATTEFFLLLDAGDIPAPDAVERLGRATIDDFAAVVVGPSTTADDDSAEHGPDGVHELRFEREALNPALSQVGAAIFAESGSLVRLAAVRNAEIGDEVPLEAQCRLGVDLLAHGWTVRSITGHPVVARQPVTCQEAAYEDRVSRTRSARQMWSAAIHSSTLRPRQIVAVAAWSVRPTSGIRRAAFIAVLIGCVLTGTLPMRPIPAQLALGAGAWMTISAALWMLSNGTLRPGDRTRWSLRTLGASFQGLRHPLAFDNRQAPILTPHSLQHGGTLIASLVALSAVLVLRGVSEQWTNALAPMPRASLVGLVAATLWILAMSLDVLRMLGRRNQMRRAVRIGASMPATVDDRPVSLVDLTALGAGMVTDFEVERGTAVTFEAMVTTRTGCGAIAVPATVRRVEPIGNDHFDLGLEFGEAHPAWTNTLVELCMIEPAQRRLGAFDGPVAADETGELLAPVQDTRRLTLRLTALLAVGGALASLHPGQSGVTGIVVGAAAAAIGGGVLAGSTRPRTSDVQSTSSSPDLAIR